MFIRTIGPLDHLNLSFSVSSASESKLESFLPVLVFRNERLEALEHMLEQNSEERRDRRSPMEPERQVGTAGE